MKGEFIKVGCIVECINDKFKKNVVNYYGDSLPKKGKLYTVVGIAEQHRGIGLFIDELPRRIFVRDRGVIKRQQISFLSTRFRIAVSNEFKIEEFNTMEIIE